MSMDHLTSQYPHLFTEVTWPWGPTRATFIMLDQIPPVEQIANVNIVPRYGDNWVAIQLSDGTLDIPGGTLEPGEDYMHAIQRELMEEAGAQLQSSQMIGAWQCFSLADKPYRSHLPFPNFYRLVLTGEIRFKQSPGNPPGVEVVSSVVCAPLLKIVDWFFIQNRYDLAELYQLASREYRK